MIQAQKQIPKKHKYLPILTWLLGYRIKYFRSDCIAGLTVMALLVPQGMAYAQLAGMPPQTAFYAAPAGLILFAVFGTSRQLVVAVSAAVAVMSASIIGDLALADTSEFAVMTTALAILAGVFSVLAGLLKLGRFAQFLSEAVLTGFVSGLALIIMSKQFPKLFGLENSHGSFWQKIIILFQELPATHLLTLVVGGASLLLMFVVHHRFKRIPAALVVVVFGIGVASVFDLASKGVHIVGDISAGLVLPEFPTIGLVDWMNLIPGALAIALVIFSEAIGPARSFASKHHYAIDENQELIGLGMANIGAGFFQGFPIGASLSKSAVNDTAGGMTQMAGIIAALTTGLVALFFTPVFFYLPEVVLAAIVIIAVSGMIRVQAYRQLYQRRRQDFWLAVFTCLSVLTFEDVLVGLLLGVILSWTGPFLWQFAATWGSSRL